VSGGLDVATGAEACELALKKYGVKTIGVVTPYQPNGDEQVIKFFEEIGFEVKKLIGLKRPTAVSIAHTTEDELRDAILDLDRAEPDAIVQVGTNLSMVRLAAEAERWLHKPVIAINAATWWMALRDNGIEDKLYGYGRLSKTSDPHIAVRPVRGRRHLPLTCLRLTVCGETSPAPNGVVGPRPLPRLACSALDRGAVRDAVVAGLGGRVECWVRGLVRAWPVLRVPPLRPGPRRPA
jgi:hypothetical protein